MMGSVLRVHCNVLGAIDLYIFCCQADTVCSFCGVSYLVFSEVKELEKKLVDALSDASKCRQLEMKVKVQESECQNKVSSALEKCKLLETKVAALEAEKLKMKAQESEDKNKASSALEKYRLLEAKVASLETENVSLRDGVQLEAERIARVLAEISAEQRKRQKAEQQAADAREQAHQLAQRVEEQSALCQKMEQTLATESANGKAAQKFRGHTKQRLVVVHTFLQQESKERYDISATDNQLKVSMPVEADRAMAYLFNPVDLIASESAMCWRWLDCASAGAPVMSSASSV